MSPNPPKLSLEPLKSAVAKLEREMRRGLVSSADYDVETVTRVCSRIIDCAREIEWRVREAALETPLQPTAEDS